MVVEFTIITDINKPLANGRYKLVTKNAKVVRSFDSSRVLYAEFINSKGKVVKRYSTIIYDNEYIKVDHTLDEVKRRLGHYEIKGYAAKAKYSKSKKV